MNRAQIERLLEDVKAGKVPPRQALERLRSLPFEDIGFAKVDHHRAIRCGFPEVILAEGKSSRQVIAIAERIWKRCGQFLATRVDPSIARALKRKFSRATYNPVARTVVLEPKAKSAKAGLVAVVSAGTSDLPVAEEARVVAECMGARVKPIYDVGVAGIHRLLGFHQDLMKANAIVVVAGMEGALASVVGGMVDKPVIGVPTSVGYGASFGGVAALLAMLNSCASNVAVVNIDNGFGAGYIAAMINRIAVAGEGRKK